ncbi:MAG: iron-sulfur cluster assembly accessory protein [Balneolia bacterium]|nr:iron-sulfur cluster assembly accessory protein [Balneolia bacterium]
MATAEKEVISITDRAAKQIKKLIDQENLPDGRFLRVGVKGGGCSGLSYLMEFDDKNDMDQFVELDGFSIIVDKRQALYLYGTVLDFKDGLDARGFVFENPQASSTCGCGASFSA